MAQVLTVVLNTQDGPCGAWVLLWLMRDRLMFVHFVIVFSAAR